MDAHATGPAIVWLGTPECTDPDLVGPKAAHLSALAAAQPVPAGFCLTAATHRASLRDGGLTPALRSAVRAAYERLTHDAGHAGDSVAVRSSALDEDGAVTSFAGQHDTYLNVVGIDALLAAIEGAWASLHGEAALRYRRARGAGAHDLALAVLVQRMVWADAAGVAFSLDPLTGDADRVVISAAWGLGESVVAGTITPDTWTLRKRDLSLLDARLGDKERMMIPSERGTREVTVPSFLRTRPSLADHELRRVAEVTRALELERGWPVDIEFAWREGEFALLQCRPVTASGTYA